VGYGGGMISGAVAGIDAHVFGGEVASPITSPRFSCVQIHDNGNVLGEKAIRSGAFIERDRLAFAENSDSGHSDFDQRRIEFDPCTACRGENAAPIGVASGKGGFDER